MTIQSPPTPEQVEFLLASFDGRLRSLEQRVAQCEQDGKLLSVLASWPWRRVWFVLEGWHPYLWGRRWRK